MSYRLGLLFALALAMAGCKTATTTPAGQSTTTSVWQSTTITPESAHAQTAAEAAMTEPVLRSDMSGNRAVIALLERADAESRAGRHEAAGASLERALRIEPRNPWVWEELARERLAEGHYDSAISMARKSNSFAGGKHRVQAVNWQVIGKARVAQGDTKGAEDAFQKADEFSRQARDEH